MTKKKQQHPTRQPTAPPAPAYTTANVFTDVSAALRDILKPRPYACWKYALLTVTSATEALHLHNSYYIEGWIVGLDGESCGEVAEHGWASCDGGLIELSPALDGARWAYFPGVIYDYTAALSLQRLPTIWHARRGDGAYRAAERAAFTYARAHFPHQVRREVSRATRRILQRQVMQ
jgi:hypothetical protein